MRRRDLLNAAVAATFVPGSLSAAEDGTAAACDILQAAVSSGQVRGATLCVRRGSDEFSRSFGAAASPDVPFLLGSITKPICITALMTLFDQGRFQIEDPVVRHLPEFSGDGREHATLRHLLTHTSGLPDQLPENNALRAAHADLEAFTAAALRTPLLFAPGSRYSYSSMGILLATEIAQRISGRPIAALTETTVFRPLAMQRSALGMGRFALEELAPVQTELAAPESGAGDIAARDWDWNSLYWRKLGAPWGGAHCSASDVARWLAEFLPGGGKILSPATAHLMRTNHNAPDQTPRGLGFVLGAALGGTGCSAETFGHTGSTGTLAWADPVSGTVCVVLTTLPGRAVDPHPRQLASNAVAAAK